MDELKPIIAIAGIVVTIYLLIKKYETRTVLIGVGLLMSLLTLNYGYLFQYGLCICYEIHPMRYPFSAFTNQTVGRVKILFNSGGNGNYVLY